MFVLAGVNRTDQCQLPGRNPPAARATIELSFFMILLQLTDPKCAFDAFISQS